MLGRKDVISPKMHNTLAELNKKLEETVRHLPVNLMRALLKQEHN